MITVGIIVSKSVAKINTDNFGLVINIITKPPVSKRIFLIAIETLVPMSVWIKTVSVLRRESISPL